MRTESTGFERLVYTDCLPGESLSGRAGFGFRAATAQADQVVQDVVARQLLYEAPDDWMRRERPVEDYPPMLAHIHQRDWYCTAAGSYLGRERKGNRQGNHLTEAVCTQRPDRYRGLRPAQLATAGLWLRADPGRTDLDATGGDWSFDAPTADDAFATVRRSDSWRERLATALTMLGEPESGKRIIVIGDDFDEVLRWICAITFLLPHRQALRTGFKAFTTRPYFGDFPIVAIRPETAGGLQLSGSAVIDLVTGTDQGPSPGPIEQTWVEQLDHADHLDVADAIELAADSELLPTAAQDLALASFQRRPVSASSSSAVISWLAGCRPERYRAYAEPVIETVLAISDRSHPLLIELDRLAIRGRLTGGSADIRLELLAEELRSASFGRVPVPEPLEPLGPDAWRPEHERSARQALVDALEGGDSGGFDPVLRIADRFGLPRLDLRREVPRSLRRFLLAWEVTPHLEVSSVYRHELRKHLLDSIDTRHVGDVAGLAEIAAAWQRRMLRWFEDPPVHSAVYRACLTAAGAQSTDVGLDRLMGDLVRYVPAGDLVAAATALCGRRSVTPGTMRRLLDARPSGEAFGPVLLNRLLDPQLNGDDEAGAAMENLRIAEQYDLCGVDPEVPEVLDAASRMRSGSAQRSDVELLLDSAPWLFTHLGTRVRNTVVWLDSPVLAVRVMRHCTVEANSAIMGILRERLHSGSWRVSQFALALVFSARSDMPHRKTIVRLLRRIARDMGGGKALEISKALHDRPEWGTDFELLLDKAGNDEALAVLRRGKRT